MTAQGSLRAMLFIPGTAEEKFAKIPRFASTTFILDLEDSVLASEKERARHLVADLIESIGADYALHVRINTPTSPHLAADLAAVVRPGLAGVVVPKAESPDDLILVNRLIDEYADAVGMNPQTIDVMATIETAAGLHCVDDIAAVGGHLTRLGFGSGDFALDLGLDWPDVDGISDTILIAKSQLVLASRVAGLDQPHDGAYSRYHDLEGLAAEARQSRRLGFSGKHVIHPSQIPVVKRIFEPSPKQIERAQRILSAFQVAESSGSAAVGVDGELVDYAIVARARLLLQEVQE
jgi:citrate lyase subunit beta/citryl-CoA lyase